MKFLIKSFIFLFISFLVLLIGLYTYAYLSPPLEISSIGKIYLYDNKNTLIETGSSGAEWISLKEIPDNYPKYILSMDRNNYSTDNIIHENLIYWLLEEKDNL